MKNLTDTDRAVLLKELEDYRVKRSTGYRVVSKAQQQDVAMMTRRIQTEVRSGIQTD